MAIGLRILLLLLSGLLMGRDIGALQKVSFEVTEEHSTTQKEEPGSLERKPEIRKMSRHSRVLPLSPPPAFTNFFLTPTTRTKTRWLLYCRLLI